MSEHPNTARQTQEFGERVRPLALLSLVGLVFCAVLLTWGAGGTLSERTTGVLKTMGSSGWAPLLYLLGALGLGRIARVWVREIPGRWVIELGVGLTITLVLTLILGIDALLTTTSAWIITGTGLVLLIPDILRQNRQTLPRLALEPCTIVIMIGALLALLMACNPPGMLWASEYGGFDALSYHLQLPREWIEQGRIWPSQHNVYSYLPGSVEGAYMHIALLMGGGMHTHGARGAMSAQILSAMVLLISATAVGTLTHACIARFVHENHARMGGVFAAALTLATPWLLVVGTLAYNEIVVVLLGTCALMIALQQDVACWKRSILCGLIVGGACLCKPTAIFMLAPSVGIVLLACTAPKSRWFLCTLLCVVAGGMTISPWLIRNMIDTGNPVFPQLSAQFGMGHWSVAQHEIYARAHHFDGSFIERFAFLALPDPDGVDHVSRFRGLTNAQWGVVPLLALVGLGSLILRRSTHIFGVVSLAAMLVPILCWAMLTHIQSRFLIPLAPMLIVLASVGITSISHGLIRRTVAGIVACGSMLWCVGIALTQNDGNPFLLVDLGTGVFMGSSQVGSPPWTAVVNEIAQEGETIYLLGDATPFYVEGDVRYNSVYDRWLIEDAIESHPQEPLRWSQTLRDQGIDLIVVSFSEIDRYARSGWLPDRIDSDQLIVWIETLGQPIEVWSNPNTGVPIRAVFRLETAAP